MRMVFNRTCGVCGVRTVHKTGLSLRDAQESYFMRLWKEENKDWGWNGTETGTESEVTLNGSRFVTSLTPILISLLFSFLFFSLLTSLLTSLLWLYWALHSLVVISSLLCIVSFQFYLCLHCCLVLSYLVFSLTFTFTLLFIFNALWCEILSHKLTNIFFFFFLSFFFSCFSYSFLLY